MEDRIDTNVYTSEKRSEINEEREEVAENVVVTRQVPAGHKLTRL